VSVLRIMHSTVLMTDRSGLIMSRACHAVSRHTRVCFCVAASSDRISCIVVYDEMPLVHCTTIDRALLRHKRMHASSMEPIIFIHRYMLGINNKQTLILHTKTILRGENHTHIHKNTRSTCSKQCITTYLLFYLN